MTNKWIHLTNLQSNLPKIGIEGLTDYEAKLWLLEAVRLLDDRNNRLKIEEYHERSAK